MSTTPPNSPPKALMMAMEPPPRPSSALFDVYLRLRPSNSASPRFLTVEERHGSHPTHITVRPLVNDNRKRAVERFAFTQVFEEDARQMDVFKGTGIVPMIEGVTGAPGCHGRDGLLATLGVTGSGKVHISVVESQLNTNALTEPYYPWNQVAARSCPDDPRCPLPELRRTACTVVLRCSRVLIACCCRRIRSQYVHCLCLPRLYVWGQPVRKVPVASKHAWTCKSNRLYVSLLSGAPLTFIVFTFSSGDL